MFYRRHEGEVIRNGINLQWGPLFYLVHLRVWRFRLRVGLMRAWNGWRGSWKFMAVSVCRKPGCWLAGVHPTYDITEDEIRSVCDRHRRGTR